MALQMNDDLLRQYVDGIFDRYDIDRSNTLTADQLVVFFNDLLGLRGNNQKMTLQQVQQSLRAMDANNDGQITKTQLFNALKKMNNQSNILSGQSSNVYNNNTNNNQQNTSIQYPSLDSFVAPLNHISQTNNHNYYAKPQVQTNNYVANQTTPGTNYYQTPITTIPNVTKTQVIQPTPYIGVPKKTIINAHEYIQPIIKTQPYMMYPEPMMSYGYPMGSPMCPPMGPTIGMGFGPMGGMGMGMFSMNPFSALLGGLFGLPFF